MSECIIGNLHVCEQARSARSACNITLENVFFILLLYVRLFISLSLFVSECLYHCAATLWLITVSAYTSLLRISSSLSLWISVLVLGYIVTHWTCICTSLDPCFSLSSLRVPLSIFGNIGTHCSCIISSSFDPHFDLYFSRVSLSHCLSLNVYTSVKMY